MPICTERFPTARCFLFLFAVRGGEALLFGVGSALAVPQSPCTRGRGGTGGGLLLLGRELGGVVHGGHGGHAGGRPRLWLLRGGAFIGLCLKKGEKCKV